jgi:hypothetical protein
VKPNDSQWDQEARLLRRDPAPGHAAERERLFAKTLQNADVVGTLIRNAARLQKCARDQRVALQGSRAIMAQLRVELRATRRARGGPS